MFKALHDAVTSIEGWNRGERNLKPTKQLETEREERGREDEVGEGREGGREEGTDGRTGGGRDGGREGGMEGGRRDRNRDRDRVMY